MSIILQQEIDNDKKFIIKSKNVENSYLTVDFHGKVYAT